MTGYLRAPGVLIEPLGEGWAVYSGLSGETHLINAESLEVLNHLHVTSPRSATEVCELLAADYGADAVELQATLAPSWEPLVEAGLVRHAQNGDAAAA